MSLRNKVRYMFENFMARGGISVFISLVVLFIIAMVFSILLRTGILFLLSDPGPQDVSSAFWTSFIQIIDPGGIAEDTASSPWFKVSAILTTFLGLIIFSMLIAFITAQLEVMLYNFRKGSSRVIEENHTLILGWNERVDDIIDELIAANTSRKNACIIVLAPHEKEDMDDTIFRTFPDTKTTRIVTRSGNPASVQDLNLVNAQKARSVIVLAACSDGASPKQKVISDSSVIKTVLALHTCCKGDQVIVAEIFSEQKRQLIAELKPDKILAINSREILGKLLVQTTLSSGLEIVYNEILSFHGCEIYLTNKNIEGIPFIEAGYHYKDGVPLGILKADGDLTIRPKGDTILSAGDSLLLLAEDDSTIKFQEEAVAQPAEHPFPVKKRKLRKERELILGWHNIGSVIISEFADFLHEGSQIDVMLPEGSKTVTVQLEEAKHLAGKLKVHHIHGNPMSKEDLSKANPWAYDNIIILSQDLEDYSPERIDSDTLVILLLLRQLQKEQAVPGGRAKIITQVLNSDNQDLVKQSNVDDFIISNKLITRILAQLSEEPRLKQLYDHLFQEEGSEIYLKPIEYYFEPVPKKLSFADMMYAASKRDEICIGLRIAQDSHETEKNFGIILNPDKNKGFYLSQDDYLIVLAENEM